MLRPGLSILLAHVTATATPCSHSTRTSWSPRPVHGAHHPTETQSTGRDGWALAWKQYAPTGGRRALIGLYKVCTRVHARCWAGLGRLSAEANHYSAGVSLEGSFQVGHPDVLLALAKYVWRKEYSGVFCRLQGVKEALVSGTAIPRRSHHIPSAL